LTHVWIIRPVKRRLRHDLNCVEWDVNVIKTTKYCSLLVSEQFLVIQPWLTTTQHGNYPLPATLR